eukprot:TCALIF_05361-PA protein Name:"Similar to Tmem53 Transmembrane protein 53 (Mus musculus)" AED:0.05 eAED:0.05 QI:0/0/0/0.5/1/1/2/0/293
MRQRKATLLCYLPVFASLIKMVNPKVQDSSTVGNLMTDQIYSSGFSDDPETPVVILLGWAGSTDIDLQKYARVYEEKGFDSVRQITPKYTVFYGAKHVPGYSKHLLNFLKTNQLSQRPLIFHMFSNMGVLSLQELEPLVREDGEFQEILPHIRGLVFDSCPGKPTLTSFFYALTDHVLTGPYFWRYIQFVGQVFKLIFTSITSPNNGSRSSWYEYLTKDSLFRMPMMFLFSKGDQCIPKSDIQALASKLESEDVQVTQVDFIDSPHVGHWDRYPAQYNEAVVKFMTSIDVIES